MPKGHVRYDRVIFCGLEIIAKTSAHWLNLSYQIVQKVQKGLWAIGHSRGDFVCSQHGICDY